MPAKDEDRAKRLAAALRENLRRRKAQARDLAEQARAEGDRDGDRSDSGAVRARRGLSPVREPLAR